MTKYLFYDKKKFVAIILMKIIQIAAFLYSALLIRDLINFALYEQKHEKLMSYVIFTAGYCLVLFVLQQITGVLVNSYQKKCIYLLRTKYFESILKTAYAKVMKKNAAYYISALTNDMNMIAQDYVAAVFAVINSVITLIITFLYTFMLSWKIALLMTGLSVLLLLLPLLFQNSINRKSYELSQSYERYMSAVKDVLGGYTSVKVYQAEEVMRDHVEKECQAVYLDSKKKENIVVTLSSCTSVLANMIKLSLIIISVYLVLSSDIDVGTITAIINLSGAFYSPVMELSGQIGAVLGSRMIRYKLDNMLHALKSEENLDKTITGELVLEQVGFSYVKERKILNQVSYHFERNKKYLIIGESGCGKTTLLRLLTKLYDRYDGKIYLDQIDYEELDYKTLFETITYVQQDEYIFDTTLRDNIDINGTGEEDKLQDCISKCQLTELIKKLPLGLETEVNEELDKISEGEKLRICLARALYKGGKIFLFDEVTASLDTRNTLEIEKMILNLQDVTVINICHKFTEEIMKQYDQILIMENGSIIRSGKFDEIVQTEEMQRYWTAVESEE